MHILSVDWDYFFPDTAEFDWGHRETVFFNEAIWSLRASCVGLISHKPALTAMRPRKQFRTFWNSLVDALPPDHLIVAESHLSLLAGMRQAGVRDATVWNFDAHHDLGYGMKEENCGNWAKVAFEEGRMAEYKLVYPQWRAGLPESADGTVHAPDGLQFEYFFEMPEIEQIDVIFICRSGSWTPTWCDASWFEFIHFFKREWPWLWNMMQYSEMAMKRRSPNLKEAREIRKQHAEMLNGLGVRPLA